MRTYAVGDVHGCADELRHLFGMIRDHAGERISRVVMLGDYFDRGPDSKGVYEFLRAQGKAMGERLVLIRGNHDQMIIDGELSFAGETVRSFGGHIPLEVLDWLEATRLLYVDGGAAYAHAGLDERAPLTAQGPEALMWRRYPRGGEQDYPGVYLYHGHSPWGVELLRTRCNVDSGCVYGRTLSAVWSDVPGAPQGQFAVQSSFKSRAG